MGAFDTFSNKADEYGQQAKEAAGKRNKAAGVDDPEQAERSGMPQEGQERRSNLDEKARRRMDPESGDESQEDDDNWA